MRTFISIIIFALLLVQCKPRTVEKTSKVVGLIVDSAMVVSAREEASKIGVEILKKGGNAFDAMVATELALAVSYPVAGNIGGGGFMVYRLNNGETGALDYREKAPMLASKNMYLDENGDFIEHKSTLGAMAVGIPGTIAGIFATHKKFGTLPIETLIQPAINLAKRGIFITKNQAKNLNNSRTKFEKANNYTIHLDTLWVVGDTLKFTELATTLERIKNNGKDEFYKGKTAEHIVNYIQELGGIISMDDLEKYEAKWRTPITFNYKGFEITSMTLPSSGGICLAQILKAIEPYNLNKIGHNSTKYIQLLTEAQRRAYADRAHYLGDPDFVSIAIDSLIDSKYINHRMESFSWEKATKSSEISYGKLNGYESEETTHYSIVDTFGNAVSVTTTLNTAYGSKVYVKNGGFFLNNEMDDFSAKPGVPNYFGLIGSKANEIAPEKRMLSSMTPTIVSKNGKLKMVIGSPGGSTIITSVLQNILNVADFKMGMQEAVNSARFHHQWLPDTITLESKGFDSISKVELQNIGYKIFERASLAIGKVDAILVLPNGKLEGGADPRGDDKAVGF
ncbi:MULTISPECIES: gamma-glutamyltransferase [Flavobacteriaceae]|uniref:Glutathione hydrolase proenzyme n=2 Tax=Flavobacteriaceae TaxID=49546 RepID=A0A4Y8AQD4_9FLAO|nr:MULTISPECIES: gamma-glutamyltransferase [Flavobacteriaceae]TEW71842.1 gamma-glutamyltransferase [Gramella jeungdoensis]GGK60245.1 gamma-glutamyltransferase [Lutibacter litoralis]